VIVGRTARRLVSHSVDDREHHDDRVRERGVRLVFARHAQRRVAIADGIRHRRGRGDEERLPTDAARERPEREEHDDHHRDLSEQRDPTRDHAESTREGVESFPLLDCAIVNRWVKASVSALGVAMFGACGDNKPPLLDDTIINTHNGDAGDFNLDSGKAPTCAYGPNQGVCSCTEVPLLGDPPNVYFVLDRSGSMNDNNKWTTIRVTVANIISKLGARIAVGATLFPTDGSSCSAGNEVLSVRRGDNPSSPGVQSETAKTLLTLTSTPASGGTPTASTLSALLPRLKALPGKTFVILATDGGPNCNAAAACTSANCIPNIESATPACMPNGTNCCTVNELGPENCLDAQPTIDATTALAQAGIPVYVIGVPGSGPYGTLLDALAQSGGTARSGSPKYFRVDTTDTTAFTTALAQVAAKITATCTFPLKSAPQDPSLVNVYTDGTILPKDPTNGWTIDGSTVTLVGAACDKVLSGEVLEVRVIEGCPTVLPN